MTRHVFKLDSPFADSMNWRAFLVVDFRDMSNWIAIAIAIPLLIWGVTVLMRFI